MLLWAASVHAHCAFAASSVLGNGWPRLRLERPFIRGTAHGGNMSQEFAGTGSGSGSQPAGVS